MVPDDCFVSLLWQRGILDRMAGNYRATDAAFNEAMALARPSCEVSARQKALLLEQYAKTAGAAGHAKKEKALLAEAEKVLPSVVRASSRLSHDAL